MDVREILYFAHYYNHPPPGSDVSQADFDKLYRLARLIDGSYPPIFIVECKRDYPGVTEVKKGKNYLVIRDAFLQVKLKAAKTWKDKYAVLKQELRKEFVDQAFYYLLRISNNEELVMEAKIKQLLALFIISVIKANPFEAGPLSNMIEGLDDLDKWRVDMTRFKALVDEVTPMEEEITKAINYNGMDNVVTQSVTNVLNFFGVAASPPIYYEPFYDYDNTIRAYQVVYKTMPMVCHGYNDGTKMMIYECFNNTVFPNEKTFVNYATSSNSIMESVETVFNIKNATVEFSNAWVNNVWYNNKANIAAEHVIENFPSSVRDVAWGIPQFILKFAYLDSHLRRDAVDRTMHEYKIKGNLTFTLPKQLPPLSVVAGDGMIASYLRSKNGGNVASIDYVLVYIADILFTYWLWSLNDTVPYAELTDKLDTRQKKEKRLKELTAAIPGYWNHIKVEDLTEGHLKNFLEYDTIYGDLYGYEWKVLFVLAFAVVKGEFSLTLAQVVDLYRLYGFNDVGINNIQRDNSIELNMLVTALPSNTYSINKDTIITQLMSMIKKGQSTPDNTNYVMISNDRLEKQVYDLTTIIPPNN